MATPIVETFNTHRMTADVVNAVATGRAQELDEVMTAINRAGARPDLPPQPLIIYGERGSGKSFLMRMIEIATTDLRDVACVLLPEEQYNIRSAPQLIEAVAARVRGDDWVSAAYRFDSRTPAVAWDEAVTALHQALDERFGPGRGMAIALIENFDAIVRDLFGKEPPPVRGKVSSASVERRAAEERLRKLLNAKSGRLMLVAAATGTVDLDYERPLFQAFQIIDLSPWSAETSIDYFNKRRALEKLTPLSDAETARARAIVEFIGGNPRLTQLLGNVLGSPDPHSIADTLDRLSDQLADYYRRRLDDLPPATGGLLDALIRGGEPCSQSKLAERVGAQQSQIADAFGYLTRSRLVAASAERAGAATLYRVNDRLFVHFYRRRYGNGQNARGLAPIAELLERFFTAQEREQHIRRHVERGEFDDARAFGRLSLAVSGSDEGFCVYRDGFLVRRHRTIFALAGLSADLVPGALEHLRDRPLEAFKDWGERAKAATDAMSRSAAFVVQAHAASRNSWDAIAHSTLREALEAARTEATTDALIIACNELAAFEWYRARNEREALELMRAQQRLLDRCVTDHARMIANLDIAYEALYSERVAEGAAAAEQALAIAERIDSPSTVRARMYVSWARLKQSRYQEGLALLERAEVDAIAGGDTYDVAEIQRSRAYTLGVLHRFDEAVTAAETALTVAQRVGRPALESLCLRELALSELNSGRLPDALRHVDAAIQLSDGTGDLDDLSLGLRLRSRILQTDRQPTPATEAALSAIDAAKRAGSAGSLLEARRQLFYLGAAATTPDLVAEFSAAIADDVGGESSHFAMYLDDVIAGVARVRLWHQLLTSLRGQPAWLAALPQWQRAFEGVGGVWSEQVTAGDRIDVYAAIANSLDDIAAVMALLPGGAERHVSALLGGLASSCSDSALLRDVATVFDTHFGPVAAADTDRLRAFADFHAATDKEHVLQRLDPDLATAIRSIWNVPQPEDALRRRGRRRAR